MLLAGRIMLSGGEILKKTFPFATTLMRAEIPPLEGAATGSVTISEPSLAVSSATTIGKDNPPSTDIRILTLLQLIGGASVFATFQVIVCELPMVQFAPDAG
jgi:hypothetical protein